MRLKHRSKVEPKVNRNFRNFFVDNFSDFLAFFQKMQIFVKRAISVRKNTTFGGPQKWEYPQGSIGAGSHGKGVAVRNFAEKATF